MKIELYIPYREWVNHLQLKDTDNVYLVSDISRVMLNAIQYEGGFKANEMITSFTQLLKKGNLFIPGFVNTLHNNDVVNMATLKPETGGLSKEAFSQFKKGLCVRTNDPFHSFFIYGKDARSILRTTFNNKDTFGKDSVFGYLQQVGGILLIVDLALYFGFTFAHYVEQQQNVSYRENQLFQFDFTDIDGHQSQTTFKIYAKKRGYIPVLNTLEDPLVRAGAMQRIVLNGIPILKIDLKEAFNVLSDDILKNKARNIIDFNLSLYLKQTIKKITHK